MENVIIIGGGPAGFTAGIYAARSLLKPKIFTGPAPGGQIVLTNDLENYPGFPEGIGGFEFFQKVKEQAEKFGAEIISDMVTAADCSQHPFKITAGDQTDETKSVIITTGAAPRKLDVPGEKEFVGRGVSYCATCDGFFFRNKHVAVIGGGNSALDEGLFLTRFASKVTIIHRRDRLREDQILQDRAFANRNIEFVWDTVVDEILGGQQVDSLRLRNVQTHATREFPLDGVFIFVGYIPNSDVFAGQLEMDENGYLIANARKQTNIPGVFAAGDIEDSVYRQVSTSTGAATIAALEAVKFVAELEGRAYPGR